VELQRTHLAHLSAIYPITKLFITVFFVCYKQGPGPVQVQVAIEVEYNVTPIWNVIGRIQGTEEPDRLVVMGSHRGKKERKKKMEEEEREGYNMNEISSLSFFLSFFLPPFFPSVLCFLFLLPFYPSTLLRFNSSHISISTMLTTTMGEKPHRSLDEIVEQINALVSALDVIRVQYGKMYEQYLQQARQPPPSKSTGWSSTSSASAPGTRFDDDPTLLPLPPNPHPIVLGIWATSTSKLNFRTAMGRALQDLMLEKRNHLQSLELAEKTSQQDSR
jgi:hypothetical protein